MTYKSISQIIKDYHEGVYKSKLSYTTNRFKSDCVFDEEKSVKWNRKEVERRNAELDEAKQRYREDQVRLSNQLQDDVVFNLVNDFSINQKQAEKIYGFAYNEKHSCMTDVFNYTVELAELFHEVNQEA